MNTFVSTCVRFVLISSIIIIQTVKATSIQGPQPEGVTPKACGQLLVDESSTDMELAIELESHPLEALLYQDPAQNLAVKHPTLVMNAFQRAKSWLYWAPPRQIPNPLYYSGTVRMFPVFSQGIPEAGGDRIIGHYREIDTFANYIERGADGDGSVSKTPLFYGPAGTGKTAFAKILLETSNALQTHQPDYFNYTYEWHDLGRIPKLKVIVNAYNEGDFQFEHNIPCPLGDSPLVLLPPGLQNQVVDLAAARVEKMIKVRPEPWKKLCPHCQYVRTAILEQEAKNLGKNMLSNSEIVSALSKYVTIKRRVIGRNGRQPKMNAEGRDVDYAGLFMAPNPFIMTQFGPSHPFAYWINGKVPSAHGGILLLDEWFRNDETLRDVMLELQENRVLARGGAPTIHLDLVMTAASNTESIEKAGAAGTSKAQIDRSRKIPMFSSVSPYDIGKTMLSMKNVRTVRQQVLDASLLSSSRADENAPGDPADARSTEPAPVTVGDLDSLFPLPSATTDGFVGPDHRLKLWIRSEDTDVHISPHSLMFISMVTSGTRLVTDAKQASELGNFKVIGSASFRDIVTRLKILTRKLTITPAEAQELEELSAYLKEGNNGISTRDAAHNWLTEAIAEARKPGNGNCVSPLLVKKVFDRLLQEGGITYPDNLTRLKWQEIMNTVSNAFILPSLQDDVISAVAHDTGAADSIYDEVYAELDALQQDSSATQYASPSGEPRAIDFIRLRELEQLYLNEQRRPLARGEIIYYHARPANSRTEVRRHEGLMGAIRRYLARAGEKLVSFDDLLKVANGGEGSAEARAKYQTAYTIMVNGLGYCPKCIRAALEMKKQAELQKVRQAESQQGSR